MPNHLALIEQVQPDPFFFFGDKPTMDNIVARR